jgi:hypothetical protein
MGVSGGEVKTNHLVRKGLDLGPGRAYHLHRQSFAAKFRSKGGAVFLSRPV